MLKRALWAASLPFIIMLPAGAVAFFAVSGRPLLSLRGALLATIICSAFTFLYTLAWLVIFEFRLFGTRRMDSRLPLPPGAQPVVAELTTTIARDSIFPRGGALYLTPSDLVFVPLRQRFPPIVMPIDEITRVEPAPPELRALFEGGLRRRLRMGDVASGRS